MLGEIYDVDHCKIVPFVLKKLLTESRKGELRSGGEIQEYFFSILKENESSLGYRLEREKKTEKLYAENPDGLLVEDERGTCGIFDIWVEYKNLNCAIVIQCPKDEIIGDAEEFKNCIRNKCLALSNEDLNVRILIQFINIPPPVGRESILEILKEFPKINFASFRLLGQDEIADDDALGVEDVVIHPEAWILI